MASESKQIKYGDLETDFFGHSQELVQDAKNKIKPTPDKGRSAGYTFMQAYFGHAHGVRDFCASMQTLCENTKKCLNNSGATFKDIDNLIAQTIEKE